MPDADGTECWCDDGADPHIDGTDPSSPAPAAAPIQRDRWAHLRGLSVTERIADRWGADIVGLLAERDDLDDQVQELTREIVRVQDERDAVQERADELVAVLREMVDAACPGDAEHVPRYVDRLVRARRVLDQTREEPPPCPTCEGQGCEEGCGRRGGCEMGPGVAGPDAHRVCRSCGGSGVTREEGDRG